MKLIKVLFVVVLTHTFASIGVAQTSSPLDVIRIGVVFDGSWERNAEIIAQLKKEITEVVVNDHKIEIPVEKVLEGNWTISGVKSVNDKLLNDPTINMVIGIGVITSQDLATRKSLSKPVIAPIVIDPMLQGIPNSKGTSGMRNLSYLIFPSSMERDINFFKEMTPFKALTIIGSKRFIDALPIHQFSLEKMEKILGVKVQILNVDSTVSEVLEHIASNTEAVYVQPILHLPKPEFQKLVNGINDRRLLGFSVLGESEVRLGLLASLNADIIPRLIRRTALNIHRILDGEDAGTLNVNFPAGRHLFINAQTARRMVVSAPYETMLEAEFLMVESADVKKPRLTLENAMITALTTNLDIVADQKGVDASKQSIRIARSNLLPHVDLAGAGTQIDKDRALGLQPERSFSATATFSQVLFSEPSWSNLSIQSSLHESRRSQSEQLRLDVVQNAAHAYINLLRVQSILSILQENLRITRTNMEIAQTHESTGSASPGELYRWEIELSTSRKNFLAAWSGTEQAVYSLNQILHKKMDQEYSLANLSLEDSQSHITRSGILNHFNDILSVLILSDFMVQEGLKYSPEIQQINAQIAAQERLLSSHKLSYFVPTVSALGQYSNNFSRGGVNAGAFMPYDQNDWSVSLQLSLPLFDGFSREATIEKSDYELQQLELQKQSIIEKIELRIRAAIQNVKSLQFGIHQSKLALEAAKKNYDIIAESYAQGALPIINLLDAQSALLGAKQIDANSLNDFFEAYMEMQRAVGRFDMLMSTDESNDFTSRLDQYMKEHRK